MKNKLVLLILLITGFSIIGAFAGYRIIKANIKDEELALREKLKDFFGGKVSICDGYKMEHTGDFLDKERMHFVFDSSNFAVFDLTSESGGYTKTITAPDYLSFKESEYEYVPPQYYGGWQISSGYMRNNYRPTVSDCYDMTYKFLLKGNEEDPKDSYTPNRLTDIKNFPAGFRSQYFMTNIGTHPSEHYKIKNEGGEVYTKAYELHYKQQKTYYSVIEDSQAIRRAMLLYIISGSLIGFIIASLIVILIHLFNPNKGDL